MVTHLSTSKRASLRETLNCTSGYMHTEQVITCTTCVLAYAAHKDSMGVVRLRVNQPRPLIFCTMATCVKRLSGKVVFITGAAQGIGKATALVSWGVACFYGFS